MQIFLLHTLGHAAENFNNMVGMVAGRDAPAGNPHFAVGQIQKQNNNKKKPEPAVSPRRDKLSGKSDYISRDSEPHWFQFRIAPPPCRRQSICF